MTGRTRARLGVRSLATYVATFAIGLALAATPAVADPPDDPITPPTVTSTPTETSPPTEPSSPVENPPPGEPAPPAPAEQPAPKAVAAVNLEITAEFDKSSYQSGEVITIALHLKNIGTEKAEGLRVHERFDIPDALQIEDIRQWGDLHSQAGLTLEPGATHTVTLSGHTKTADAATVSLAGRVFDRTGFFVTEFSFTAPITTRLGRAAGIVYGDKNNNGVFDDGEGLPDVTVTLSYRGQTELTTTSDKSGQFDFGKIPTARYFSGSIVTQGWQVPFDEVAVDESDKTSDLRLRGQRPLDGALKATVKFTKNTYKPGEVAHVTVALANSGKLNLFGIVAACNRGGFDSSLDGTGPGWGDLDLFAKGVTIPAGKTVTLDVSETVRKAAQDVGRVGVGCDFGFREMDIENHATAGDQAAVPGGIATVVGDVLHFPEGNQPGKPSVGIPGVKVTLVHPERDCPVVAETISDAKGHFEMKNLAPDFGHVVYFIPPPGWKIKFQNPTPTDVRAGGGGRLVIEVEPGDGPLPTVPTCGTTTQPPTSTTAPAPEPQGRSGGGLASTGASVVGLSALGALALLLGVGTVIITRRRRKTA